MSEFRFRVSADLKARAKDVAERRGISLSELMRHAVQRIVETDADAKPHPYDMTRFTKERIDPDDARNLERIAEWKAAIRSQPIVGAIDAATRAEIIRAHADKETT